MFLIVTPYLLWQVHNHWPTLEFLHNGRAEGKNTILNPLRFFLAQLLTMSPLAALLWIPGIVALLRAKSIRHCHWLGLTYIFFYVIMDAMHAKDYYLQGIYPALFAAGAIAWEHRFARSRSVERNRLFAFPLYEALLIIGGLIILPMSSPVLHPATWVRYTHALHLVHDDTETMATGPLPQFYADRFGWQQQVATVITAYRSLTPAEQQHVCIFGGNYGEAGAIDFLGGLQHAGLPPAMSGQNNYYLWGTHGCDPNVAIAVISDTPQEIALKYQSAIIAGHMDDPLSMPFEHKYVYILRGRRPSAPFHWIDEKFYF